MTVVSRGTHVTGPDFIILFALSGRHHTYANTAVIKQINLFLLVFVLAETAQKLTTTKKKIANYDWGLLPSASCQVSENTIL